MKTPKQGLAYLFISLFLFSCTVEPKQEEATLHPTNILDYSGTPISAEDRSSLAFSDQGAWFGYGLPDIQEKKIGFSGPFLMTQGQGEWSSPMLSQLELFDSNNENIIHTEDFESTQCSYNSHLEETLESTTLKIRQTLFFSSAHSAMITVQIENKSEENIVLEAQWSGETFPTGIPLSKEGNSIKINSARTSSKGIIQVFNNTIEAITASDSSYSILLEAISINPQETKLLTITHSFIFPRYDSAQEQKALEFAAKTPLQHLKKRMTEKAEQLSVLNHKLGENWQDSIYQNLVAKTALTLQNNTRVAAGELKHDGLFPSYHYKWFLGFWAWDSWKHAVAVAHYNPELAKNQIRAMYDYQLDNGFIVDCIYRDTTIEKHNYRNSKPPLSAWAVWKVYQQDKDRNFISEMYAKIVKQHQWWYAFRDYDKDGICEFGSTDGTLVAAKWESGMDNAVRFDNNEMVKSSQKVFSLNQESVDLNAYLYAEKIYLSKMAIVINKTEDTERFSTESEHLKTKIQDQFFDAKTGWFYDTSIDGKDFVQVMGCEGWIPLWANVATPKQAEAVKQNMMNPVHFNTKVPFQTLSASHPDFQPNRGYWRGPNWLDQAYFGVKGLQNYGYHDDAYKASYKLIHNAQGVLDKGESIRENYQPITGEGLESHNFSWSAAHYLLLLIEE